jgi:hypothetical protein
VSASPAAGVIVAPVSYRVTYGWAVPSTTVQITSEAPVPIAQSPATSLPYLVAITAGDHPEGNPAYARISFTFRGGFPSYRFGYVREVLTQGKGDPVPLTGNGFLEVVFVGAQAHDNAGRTTIRKAPAPRLGIGSLASYGFGGDYEGYVSYGLGLQAAPNSDQVLRIRTGELVRGRGPAREYVIHVDVERA